MTEFRLNRIQLYNVFNYKGLNEIDLSADNDRNIFLFVVHNGGGKTSLFLAIKWGFYGNSIEYKKDEVKLKNKDFLNSDAEDDVFYVNISFFYAGCNYFLTRRCANPNKDESTITLKKDGVVLPDDQARLLIQDLIPPDYGDFFMFNGETLNDIANNQKDGKKIEGVLRLLGLKQLQDLLENLKSLRTRLKEKLANIRNCSEASDANLSKINKLSRVIENYEDTITKAEAELDELNGQHDKAIEERDLYSGVDRFVRDLDQARSKSNMISSKLGYQEAILKGDADRFYMVFIEDELKNMKLNDMRELEEFCDVPTFDESAIKIMEMQKSIIEQHKEKCPLCANEIDQDTIISLQGMIDEFYRKNERYEENKRDILRLKNNLNIIESVMSETIIDFRSELNNYYNLQNEMIKNQRAVNRLEKDSRNSDIEEVKRLSEMISGYDLSINKCNKKISDAKSNIEIANQEYIKLTNERARSNQLSVDEKRLTKKHDYVQRLIDHLTEIIDEGKKHKRNEILARANEVFLKMTNKTGTYKGLEYEDDQSFSLVIRRKDGAAVLNPSSGEKHVLAISFLISLSLNSDCKSPMMMDTPLARLDNTHSQNIGSMLATLDNQVIFLAQPTEISAEVRSNMGPAIAAEFSADVQADNSACINRV